MTSATLPRRQTAPSHLVRETLVSVLINGAFSALFVWLVFGGKDKVEVWGTGGLALDFLPQTFVIAFMATLVPSAITRKKLRDGKLPPLGRPARKLPRNLFLRALLIAAVVTPVAVAASVLLLGALRGAPVPLPSVFILKVGYGAMLALAVTSFAVREAMADRPT